MSRARIISTSKIYQEKPLIFSKWPGYLANGASKNAKLHVGLPGNPAEAGSYFYIPPSKLATVLGNSQGVKNYNGFMIYDAGDSDQISVNGCNYAQEVKSVMSTGNPC